MSPLDKAMIMRRAHEDIEGVKREVFPIIADIRARGDEAILEYLERFDNVRLTKEELVVSEKDVREAYQNTDPLVLEAIRKQIALSRKFHHAQESQIPRQWEVETIPGVRLGQKKTAIDSVGLYVPGGTAPYPTVMQILAVPAKIAGVERIVGVTPPRGKNYEVIVAAEEAGVDELYRVGGVAAIAALAYGTETIKPVDKIVGPGNKYVTAAKLSVFGDVGIDMPAGPSEVLILADEEANPAYCAADMLSAAEHDPNAAGVLVTWSKKLAEETQKEIARQLPSLSRQHIIKQSLSKYSAIILVQNKDEAIEFANEYAPEHLEIMTGDCESLVDEIRNAGSIFLGEFGSKALGDYATGANHVLPTGGGAKMFSPIGVETFMKTSEVQYVTEEGLRTLAEIMKPIVEVENLDAHWNSVAQRLEEKNN
ncbi:MAG: histidinol dehydrogenase [Candidatus Levybacteria bacterium RIFCSPLOWO2_02_FULL_37_10]|nr:MAG: histidinol dehydrogenase [Candidatus Levybacteria bacterium RIFCSPHIGHO2_01_FULL_37_33]OGH17320.1 MAG: histidinol dehydrogenase [Candidatus Levybacteria bacterium RIFCSPHIGHO2_02_FULL_37_11]OGH29145.1 MAG: histidinol dehydrogenase [Candidatus Levybacteria bacterium RIFCSPHIGHO2_12_FULL_37_12]OGH33071.1 MAG: histidinol dehydrogenase [Candidatus Levybacteria bacterium RIFCSPLOWO2_01_FULL_36_54]OGH43225.1 MAG: histidinol dehydrogenase [Candidatus Levybacteria bacterium RIFCSPLOWO2_02_FULL_